MIDTVKLSVDVSTEIKDIIESCGQICSKIDLSTGEIFYNLVHNKIESSYSSSINLSFNITGYDTYKLFIECSLHKVLQGQNAFNGFYDLTDICKTVKKIIELSYNLVLPDVSEFFLERIDIARVFDLENQENIFEYLYILSFLSYPRRNVLYIEKESVYVPGRTCTLKIYNKLLEFRKHDKAKLKKINMVKNNYDNEFNVEFFDIVNYENKIKGYLRYELEIHKRMLQKVFKANEIKVIDVNYLILEKLWVGEFMKLYNFKKENIISDRLKVKEKLIKMYGNTSGNTLYDFYLRIITEGESYVQNCVAESTFYRKRKKLEDAGIDFSRRYILADEHEINSVVLNFNPFENLREVC